MIGRIGPLSLASFVWRLRQSVENWPEVLARLVAVSGGLRRGEISTRLREGGLLVAPPSRAAWWPVFEMFAEDLYRLESTELTLCEGDVVVDLGAHIGAAAVALARRWPPASLVCVEPNPAGLPYLEQNLAANGVPACVVREAVGASDGETTLYGVRLASCEASTSYQLAGESRQVPVRSFRRIMEESPGPVRVVKLDCEGAEHEVLQAADPALLVDVRLVLLEYHKTAHPASSWPAIERRLGELGFATLWQMPFPWAPGLGMAAFGRPPAHQRLL